MTLKMWTLNRWSTGEYELRDNELKTVKVFDSYPSEEQVDAALAMYSVLNK